MNQEGRLEVLESASKEIDPELCVPRGRTLTPDQIEALRARYQMEIDDLRNKYLRSQAYSIESSRKHNVEKRRLLDQLDELQHREERGGKK